MDLQPISRKGALPTPTAFAKAHRILHAAQIDGGLLTVEVSREQDAVREYVIRLTNLSRKVARLAVGIERVLEEDQAYRNGYIAGGR